MKTSVNTGGGYERVVYFSSSSTAPAQSQSIGSLMNFTPVGVSGYTSGSYYSLYAIYHVTFDSMVEATVLGDYTVAELSTITSFITSPSITSNTSSYTITAGNISLHQTAITDDETTTYEHTYYIAVSSAGNFDAQTSSSGTYNGDDGMTITSCPLFSESEVAPSRAKDYYTSGTVLSSGDVNKLIDISGNTLSLQSSVSVSISSFYLYIPICNTSSSEYSDYGTSTADDFGSLNVTLDVTADSSSIATPSFNVSIAAWVGGYA